uniref:DUF4346 domain-containing protein n=1 Tax=Hildenbrandia rubra TaxID=31481 RepID=A0A1C9CFY8_9FLOR|nr:hypothetical protein Hrub_064 [Hildenbrandia rubra]AOM67308.1 hypothetical protein Hrub_064 [Hildenbrandia rubra]
MYINITLLDSICHFQNQAKNYFSIDYTNYFLIFIKHQRDQIIVQHIDQTNSSKLKFVTTWCSRVSQSIFKALLKNYLITSKLSNSHYVYLSCELTKAELSMILNQEYIQD